MTPIRCAARSARQGPCPSSQGAPVASGKIRYDRLRYKDRHLVENAFCRLKDFRRVATRYDKLAANFLSRVALGTALAL